MSAQPAPLPPRNSRPVTDKERLNRAYAERNALAVAFCKAALLAGWEAGRAFDNDPRKKWSAEWRHVVYVTLPGGEQVSWHMSPDEVHLLEGLPQYPREWDGSFVGKNPDWPQLIQLQSTWKIAGARTPPRSTGGSPAPVVAKQTTSVAQTPASKPDRSGPTPSQTASPTLPFSQTPRPSLPLVPARTPVREAAAPRSGKSEELSTDQVETIAKQINASFVGPRAVRTEEFASYQAALSWLVRNRNTIVEGACISAPGKPVEHFSVSQIKEISARQAADAARAVIPSSAKAAASVRQTHITDVDIDLDPLIADGDRK